MSVMQRDYDEFKIRINALVAKANKAPEERRTMQGRMQPQNSIQDHSGIIQAGYPCFFSWFTMILNLILRNSFIQVLLGPCRELPSLIYVSREKRPGFDHHKKAGAMNALVVYLWTLAPFYFSYPPSMQSGPSISSPHQCRVHLEPGLRPLHQQQQGAEGSHVFLDGSNLGEQDLLRPVSTAV